MYVSPPSKNPADYGLGIWGAVAMVAGTLVSQWIAGDGSGDVPDDTYYPQAKLGVVYCAGAWNVAALREAIENNPTDPAQAQISRYFVSGVSQRDAVKWARYGRPRTPLEQAGALVAAAHGGSDCKGGPESSAASGLISRMLEVERARQATPAGQVFDVVASGQGVLANVFGPLPAVVPGVNTGVLLAAAGALALFLLRK